MFAPPAYKIDDRSRLVAFISAHPFATLVAIGPDGPVIAYAPLVIQAAAAPGGRETLVGHIARANPFWPIAQGKEVVALFAGPDAYVSPSFYPSKQEHGKTVPTWNYIRVEARGILTVETSLEEMQLYIDRPTTMMERDRRAPWSIDDAPVDYIDRLKRGIVGVSIDLRSLEGAWKLSQDKAAADRNGVVEGLRRENKVDVADEIIRASES